jgi:hypothetical protein
MQYEEDYWSLLKKQVEKHLNSLGVKKNEWQIRGSKNE